MNIDLPITLRPKIWSAIGLVAVCAAFVAIGVWMRAEHPFAGNLSIVFFGLGVAVGTVQMLPGSTCLRLDADGIRMTTMFRQRPPIPWDTVAEFGVMVIRHNGTTARRIVGFNFVASHTRSKALRKVNTVIGGFEAALPDTYGWKAEELVELLRTIQLRQLAKKSIASS